MLRACRGSELTPFKSVKYILMSRKKAAHPEKLYTHPVRTRVTQKAYQRLEKLVGKSDSHSIGEVARKILSGQEIKVFAIDASLNAVMEELALIRKELRAIGVNINQITRSFNQDRAGAHRAFYALKVADLYNKVDEKVERLLIIISKLAERWLQK